jgi:MFS family permease
VSGAFYGEFLVLYMLALGATSASIGVRSSINSAASLLAPLLGAWLVERTGRRKGIVIWGAGGAARMALVFAMLIPFAFTGQAAVVALVVVLAMQAFTSNISMPAWRSLFGDIVPLPIRGRFMGLRMVASNVVVVAIVPLAGWMIRSIGGLQGYQVALLIAAIMGFVATAFYARIPEPKTEEGADSEHAAGGGFVAGLRLFAKDKVFFTFCLVNWVWTLGIQLSGPFFSVHMVETLGFQVDTIALITTVSTVFNVIALRFAGPLVDRKGAARIMAISMLLVPFMPVAWIFARTPFHVILVKIYGFIAWAGFHVAVTPLLLRLTPPAHRAQFIAIFSTVESIAAIIGPILAGLIYANYGFTTNLALSAMGRGLGGLLFLALFLRHRLYQGEGQRASGRTAAA